MIYSSSIITLPTYMPKSTYCWNPSWVKEYESSWSILEKFKYANHVSARDMLVELGSSDTLSKKIINCNKKNGNLNTLAGFDRDKLTAVLGIDLIQINNEYSSMFDLLPKGSYPIVRERFTFCRTCIRHGFHSMLHQICVIKKCPYHNRKVEDQCPQCGQGFYYRFSDEQKNPFECNCGYKFYYEAVNFTKQWSRYKPNLKSPQIRRWVSMLDSKTGSRPELIVFDQTDYERYPNALEHILSVYDPENELSDCNYYHAVSKFPTRFRSHGKTNIEYNQYRSNINDYQKYNKLIDQTRSEIYWSTLSTYSAIAKHIRNNFLKQHKSCLHRAKRGEMSCRYADAYIHWCKFIHNFKNCWRVDDSYYRPMKPLTDGITFVSIQDQEELHRLIYAWDGGENRRYESLITTKWVISKFLGTVLLNHFYNWVRVAARRKSTDEIMYLPFLYQNLPFAVLKVPANTNECLEYHVWTRKEQQAREINQINLDCPYDSVRKRRGDYYSESDLRFAALFEDFDAHYN